MTYEESIPYLQHRHFYPNILKRIEKKKEVIYGLVVECSPLLYNETKKRLEEILGEGWKVDIEKGEGDGRIILTKK